MWSRIYLRDVIIFHTIRDLNLGYDIVHQPNIFVLFKLRHYYNKQKKVKVSSGKCSNETRAAQEKKELYLIQTNIVIVKEVDLYVYRT